MNTINDAFGLLPKCLKKDAPALRSLKEQAQNMFGMQLNYDFHLLEHFQGRRNDKVRTTRTCGYKYPGHTPGGVTFYCKEENIAFTGDTLFRGSVGRTDFEGGSMFQLISS
ncbi:MBL fold metallo-hydrolase [Prevotella intermedia]|uniref:MBL fold metallo-hydrolase n=1 Tax=Prevotella intermedia TaxID=28131 RepID=UPI00293723A0|nr:MBL fold metallo-hydrolase [Prevotella intermedia]